MSTLLKKRTAELRRTFGSYNLLCLVLLLTSGIRNCEGEIGLSKAIKSETDSSTQETAAKGVLRRLLPQHESSFELQIVSEDLCGGKACFQLDNHPSRDQDDSPQIRISGTTGVELCAGLYWYLKRWCGAHISWNKTGGKQLRTIPAPGLLPSLENGSVQVQRPVPWNYYQNVVTSSYSFAWWDWERWEQEIDWMVLQGINLPLAATGQETIWHQVFQSETFNLSRADLDDYFGGPAFLAWARMGNLHGNTVDGDERWCCTYLLDPTDPLFGEIGKAFVEHQMKVYGGTQHIYNCDTFNENLPPTDDPAYISTLGTAVYEAMSAGDSQAVWLMQGWLFASDDWFWKPPQMKALLHSVPVGKMVVLDLFADVKSVWQRTNHFYGIPYIWCMLHNFGGNMEMYGRVDTVASGPIEAFTSLNSTMVGVGMCMEGIEHNPVVYELMAEMSFQSQTVHVKDWIVDYSKRRYGRAAEGAQTAWKLLHQTIYNCQDGVADHNGDVMVEFPDTRPLLIQEVDHVRPGRWATESGRVQLGELRRAGNILAHSPHIWYSQADAVKALGLLLSSADELGDMFPYRYDLVDLTRQVLSKRANQLYLEILAAFHLKRVEDVKRLGGIFLELFSDTDKLLGSCGGFLLGPWLESAKSLAANAEERELYEWNARTQVTMWFDNTDDKPSPLHDYANKMWSGLIQDYYLPRAALYISLLEHSLRENSTFPFDLWRKEWISLTNNWQMSHSSYPTKPVGDSVQIVKNLYLKYSDVLIV